ncbi:hypothetical protein H5410_059151 [Solanum commersonii]|uniref:GST N-terminal domain-containing protein n=1 Tax=Solanum commersonii TaxID=4109 RepID=A0A9J5W1V1_SOLCO|nr:hypothetical protein H5410_059151 [Solanum commersonii]
MKILQSVYDIFLQDLLERLVKTHRLSIWARCFVTCTELDTIKNFLLFKLPLQPFLFLIANSWSLMEVKAPKWIFYLSVSSVLLTVVAPCISYGFRFVADFHSTNNNKNASKALIAAEYTGVKVEHAKDFQMGVSNKTSEFLEMNPIGKVPVLQTPDGPVFESNAIARYDQSMATFGPISLVCIEDTKRVLTKINLHSQGSRENIRRKLKVTPEEVNAIICKMPVAVLPRENLANILFIFEALHQLDHLQIGTLRT